MSTVAIKPEILDWAIDRSGLDPIELEKSFPKLASWREKETHPTLNQLENFARKTRTPLGYLFLSEPPQESLPIPFFRTTHNNRIERPSPNLIETIQQMQWRGAWMRDFLIDRDENPLPFVGSMKIKSDINQVVASIREVLKLDEDWASNFKTWTDALSGLSNIIDDAGILVMKNGVVGNNNYRKLDVDEFRGFVLIDNYAPLIFVNNSDFKGAQMFTLAHELAHIWIGEGAIFNLDKLQPYDNNHELFCDKVAAELLVPERKLREFWRDQSYSPSLVKNITNRFKVSPLVVNRRALDLGYITKQQFFSFYNNYKDELEEIKQQKKKDKKDGGNFYNNQNVRIGKRFASAVIISAKEGSLAYREAFKLTGLKGKTFDEYSHRLNIK